MTRFAPRTSLRHFPKAKRKTAKIRFVRSLQWWPLNSCPETGTGWNKFVQVGLSQRKQGAQFGAGRVQVGQCEHIRAGQDCHKLDSASSHDHVIHPQVIHLYSHIYTHRARERERERYIYIYTCMRKKKKNICQMPIDALYVIMCFQI